MRKKQCIRKGCKKKAHSRGICSAHYESCRKLVVLHGHSWEKLEEAGLCLPAYSSSALNRDLAALEASE